MLIKIYYKVILIKTVSYEHKDEQIGQWNRECEKNPEPCMYRISISDRDNSSYKRMMLRQLILHMEKVKAKSNPYLMTYIKIKFFFFF